MKKSLLVFVVLLLVIIIASNNCFAARELSKRQQDLIVPVCTNIYWGQFPDLSDQAARLIFDSKNQFQDILSWNRFWSAQMIWVISKKPGITSISILDSSFFGLTPDFICLIIEYNDFCKTKLAFGRNTAFYWFFDEKGVVLGTSDFYY